MIEKARDLWSGDDEHVKDAAGEYSDCDTDILYVVYGHTHDPKQVPIEVTRNKRKRVYINTGTWRARHRRCEQGDGFITWKNLTYVIFYKAGEKASSQGQGIEYPTFETWSGAVKDE